MPTLLLHSQRGWINSCRGFCGRVRLRQLAVAAGRLLGGEGEPGQTGVPRRACRFPDAAHLGEVAITRPTRLVTTTPRRSHFAGNPLEIAPWLHRRPHPHGHQTRRNRRYLRRRQIKHTIPEPKDQRANRTRRGSQGGRPTGFDKVIYERRNEVERTINALKNSRAVATRYDKRVYIFHGTVTVTAVRLWPRP